MITPQEIERIVAETKTVTRIQAVKIVFHAIQRANGQWTPGQMKIARDMVNLSRDLGNVTSFFSGEHGLVGVSVVYQGQYMLDDNEYVSDNFVVTTT